MRQTYCIWRWPQKLCLLHVGPIIFCDRIRQTEFSILIFLCSFCHCTTFCACRDIFLRRLPLWMEARVMNDCAYRIAHFRSPFPVSTHDRDRQIDDSEKWSVKCNKVMFSWHTTRAFLPHIFMDIYQQVHVGQWYAGLRLIIRLVWSSVKVCRHLSRWPVMLQMRWTAVLCKTATCIISCVHSFIEAMFSSWVYWYKEDEQKSLLYSLTKKY